MSDSFILTVPFDNNILQLDAEVQPFGYIHRIIVMIDGVSVVFEPDEERNYRAIVPDDTMRKNINVALLKAIAHQLEAELK